MHQGRVYTPAFQTDLGLMYQGDSEQVLRQQPVTEYVGRTQLILTSPPFPLNKKKKYGNLTGEAYLKWLTGLAPLFREYLKPDGSIVLELGNAWNPGSPTMSTLPLKALLGFLEAGKPESLSRIRLFQSCSPSHAGSVGQHRAYPR